jgi:hypothetical protein
VWYAQYTGEGPILDPDGWETGETGPTYTTPVAAMLNISPATGEAVTQTFGDLSGYSKVLATARDFPFDEKTVFWVDRPTDQPHDYKVVKVAKSLNGLLVALEQVNT